MFPVTDMSSVFFGGGGWLLIIIPMKMFQNEMLMGANDLNKNGKYEINVVKELFDLRYALL